MDLDPMPPVTTHFDQSMQHEDWEDWLRWDPAAEPTSPEDTFNSASSKNDSPLQDPVYPMGAFSCGKSDTETLYPPLIFGEDAAGEGTDCSNPHGNVLFGAPSNAGSDFVFNDFSAFGRLPLDPSLDVQTAEWTPLINADAHNVTLSALSTEHTHRLPSTSSFTVTTPALHDSPSTTSEKRSSTSSNPPKKRGGRKRKVQPQEDQSPADGENGASQDGDEPPLKKTSHNVIEKRYRNNLNDKIVELRNSVPSLRALGRTHSGVDGEDLEGLTPAHKLNKATVMGKATEYIKHLERRNQTMADEMASLKARLASVESAIGRSRDRQAGLGDTSPAGFMPQRDGYPHESVRQRPTAVQQQYGPQQAQPTYARPPNPPVEAQNQAQYVQGRGGVMNKVMLGTMAGIMVVEGFASPQQPGAGTSEQSMFAVPVAPLKRGFVDPGSTPRDLFTRHATLSLLKVAFVIGCLLYLLAPLLSFSPRRKQKARLAVQLPQAPSLASPVEVRRKAWLTAIQTVWVPKHFLVEVVAVGFKMVQLSFRRLIGSEAFTSITGTTKEEEAARIKAWDIAIDAQLAGGDAEVSYYRLLLTLMESGTLPDSPARLMQKAVHFRVFFWEIANAGYGNMIGFKLFTEKVGNIYWDSARKLQRELVHAEAQGRPCPDDMVDLLPDHLARLGELECDEVLNDEMIQRAWNLAWNKSSAYRTVANAARDSVIEDHAIRSPLDAVAAWYTNATIDETLVDALNEKTSCFDTEYYIGLALSVAPPASSTHLRALAAKAILSNSNRDSNIVAALEALPVTSPTGGMNLVTHAPASPDVCIALTVAKVIALCSPSSAALARRRGLEAVRNFHLAPRQHTLLTAVAVFRLLRLLSSGSELPRSAEHSMEQLAASLRVWAGTSLGVDSGVGNEGRGKMVTMCLGVAKRAGGWDEIDRDSGYGSEQSPARAPCAMN